MQESNNRHREEKIDDTLRRKRPGETACCLPRGDEKLDEQPGARPSGQQIDICNRARHDGNRVKNWDQVGGRGRKREGNSRGLQRR